MPRRWRPSIESEIEMAVIPPKVTPLEEATEQLSAVLNQQSFEELSRTNYQLVKAIVALVAAGKTPDEIAQMVLHDAPQRWPLAQATRQAAAWIAREG
jgi:hypothetical protein